MKIKRANEIKPNKSPNIIMVYYHACRTLARFENELKRKNAFDGRSHFYITRLQYKLEQVIAKWKSL